MNLKKEKNHVRVGIKLKSETNTTRHPYVFSTSFQSKCNKKNSNLPYVHINESKNNCTKHLPGE